MSTYKCIRSCGGFFTPKYKEGQIIGFTEWYLLSERRKKNFVRVEEKTSTRSPKYGSVKSESIYNHYSAHTSNRKEEDVRPKQYESPSQNNESPLIDFAVDSMLSAFSSSPDPSPSSSSDSSYDSGSSSSSSDFGGGDFGGGGSSDNW